jgi:hypothetical protein
MNQPPVQEIIACGSAAKKTAGYLFLLPIAFNNKAGSLPYRM